jgi:ferredoxin-type protein NapG
MATQDEYGRRQFFRDSVVSIARAAYELKKQSDAPPEPMAAPAPPRPDFLRPPGAVEEALFLERCTRCQDCAKACPHGSIGFHAGDGTPVIYPDQVPCYLCDDTPCIQSCATEALLPVADRADIRMGLAAVSHRVCTAGQGCHACVSQCPMHALEMNFGAMRLHVLDDRCVGCGICEHVCQSVNDALAIKVYPPRIPTV